jgi:hypothetical protein
VKTAVVVLASFAVLVPAGYALAGGADYTPHPVADPCAPRQWHNEGGVSGLAAQIALSATDGAACRLHVSRESLVLALASRADLTAFGRQHGLDDAAIERAMRDGLQRSIDDASRAGAIGVLPALALGQLVQRLPLDRLLHALQGTTLTW